MTQQLTDIVRTADGRPDRLVVDDTNVGRAIARSLAEGFEDADRLSVARAFGFELVGQWWSALVLKHASSRPLREPFEPVPSVRLPATAVRLAYELGRALAEVDVEAASYEIGRMYTAMLPPKHRSTYGIYYTPPELSQRLIVQATKAGVDWTDCRVLDPACGGGAFLAPVAQRIVETLPDCAPEILVENIGSRLRGYEIDPFGAWLSQVTVDAILAPLTRQARPLPRLVSVCDALRQDMRPDRFDLVIGNPPYGKVRLDAAERARFKRSLFGHANLYGLFTDLALQHVTSCGVVAFVTPTSFLAGEYFKNLRDLLGHDAPPVSIDFVSLRKGVFEDVLQETALVTYRRGGERKTTVSEIAPDNGIGIAVKRLGKFGLPKKRSEPWLLPRRKSEAGLVRVLAQMKYRLSDWGYGVRTGPLVWNRYKDQLTRRPGLNRYPLVWAEAVTSEGRFIWRAERRNHMPYFEFMAGDEWLLTDTRCVLLQRTTAKEQPRRLVAATLPDDLLSRHGAVVVENHLNMLRPVNERLPVSMEVLVAFLNSQAADRAFRCVSGSVAVSAYELESLPLPPVDALGELFGLVKKQAAKEEVEAACARLYGLAV